MKEDYYIKLPTSPGIDSGNYHIRLPPSPGLITEQSEGSKLQRFLEDAHDGRSVHDRVPDWITALCRYRYGPFLLLLLPAVIFLLSLAALALRLVQLGHAQDKLYQLQGQLHDPLNGLRSMFALTNAHFDDSEVAPLGDGYYIEDVDPQDVYIMQADTRPFHSFERASYDSLMDFPEIHDVGYVDSTALYNMWYALRHGYRYMRVPLTPPTDRHHTWAKIPAIRDAVKECPITVFLDGDALVNRPQYSVHELMRRWGFHQKASLMLAHDPEGQGYGNENGTNTGFWVIRRSELSLKLLEDLWNCPVDIKGCEEWRYAWAHEQQAFSKYFRPHLEHGVDYIDIPCDDANGYPGQSCTGHFVSHFWTYKDAVPPHSRNVIMSEILYWLSTTFDGSETRPRTELAEEARQNF